MKEKLFNALKQEYSHLGLGDDVFQGQAESLANLGFVTDDNIKEVVKSQKSFLEGLQKNTEKRVTDAQKKAEEKARKEFEEETKKKEEEAKKAAEEAEKKRIAEEEAKKAEEEARKAEEEARLAKEAKEKAEQEEAERKRKELEAKKVPEQLIKQFEEFQAKAKEREEAYQKQAEEREAQYNAQLEAMRKASEEADKRYASWQEELKTNYTNLETNYNNMIKERDEARAIAAKKQRSEFILSKANELGIPKWRVDEGFVLADDATEDQIAEKLSTIAQNVKTQLLPKDKHYVPSTDNKATKEEVDAIVKSMIK